MVLLKIKVMFSERNGFKVTSIENVESKVLGIV